MDDITVEVRGLAELDRKMSQLSEKLATEAALRANEAGARVFQDAAIALAPVKEVETPGSNSLAPGELKRDIHRDVSVTGAAIGPGEKTGHVARWLEDGHKLIRGGKRARKGKKWGNVGGQVIGRVAPHPFLRPAFDIAKQAALEAFEAELRKALEEL